MVLTDCRYPRKVPSPGVILVSGRDLNRSGTWCVSHLVNTGEVRIGKEEEHVPSASSAQAQAAPAAPARPAQAVHPAQAVPLLSTTRKRAGGTVRVPPALLQGERWQWRLPHRVSPCGTSSA